MNSAQFYTLTSYDGNGSQDKNFKVSNSPTDFTTSFREPIRIKPYSKIKIQFVKVYMDSNTDYRPCYIVSPTFTTLSSQVGEIGNVGLLGIVNLEGDDTGGKETLIENNSFPYIDINNTETLNISEIHIRLLGLTGEVYDNINEGANNSEKATLLGLHIITPQFKDIV
jgi:hypothetical protein